MKVYFLLALVILVICFAILPLFILLFSKNEKQIKAPFRILAILYLIIVFIGVFTDIKIDKVISIKLFENLNFFSNKFNFSITTNNLKDFIINILMLAPFGFLIFPLFKKKSIIKTVVMGLMISILIELSQFALPILRNPELSDIILNTLGCFIGSVFSLIFQKKRSNL